MEVMIDGVRYMPVPDAPETDKSLLAALDVRFTSSVGNQLTVRDYLHKLLAKLWRDGESFSGKRPFGVTGWEYELYMPLEASGFLGTTDTDEGLSAARDYVELLINAAFNGVQ